jgi:hypothetical protein
LFVSEGCGGEHHEWFYDVFPELEKEGKVFAMTHCSGKDLSFKVSDLTKFIDRRFHELTRANRLDDRSVRSDDSCRLDLHRWGGSFDQNSQRSYFKSHEHSDVVKQREEFTSHFINRINHYYTISHDDQPKWTRPILKPCIAICCCSIIQTTLKVIINVLSTRNH